MGRVEEPLEGGELGLSLEHGGERTQGAIESISNVSPRAYAPGRLRALTNQDLRFDLLGVYAGVSTLALHYRNQRGGLVVEVLTFENGLVTVGHATHLQSEA